MTDHVTIPETHWDKHELCLAIVTCMKCGRDSALARDGGSGHTVDAEGKVSPSIVCPHDGCDWHVFGRLEGWTP